VQVIPVPFHSPGEDSRSIHYLPHLTVPEKSISPYFLANVR
jgi:hypothetical protein